MELRVGRSIALVVVIVALAMLTLRHRSEQLHQRLPRSAAAGESSPTPSSPPLPSSTPADPDSAATVAAAVQALQSEEHTSELQSLAYLVCRLLLEKKKNIIVK